MDAKNNKLENKIVTPSGGIGGEDPHNNKVLLSLRYCKGINENSLLSILIPNYESISNIISYLNIMKEKSNKNIIRLMDIDDEEIYTEKAHAEAINFLEGLVYAEQDKKETGLILYIGFIDNGSNKSVKVYHTFPIEKRYSTFKYMSSNRFNLKYLNECKWFTDEFGRI